MMTSGSLSSGIPAARAVFDPLRRNALNVDYVTLGREVWLWFEMARPLDQGVYGSPPPPGGPHPSEVPPYPPDFLSWGVKWIEGGKVYEFDDVKLYKEHPWAYSRLVIHHFSYTRVVGFIEVVHAAGGPLRIEFDVPVHVLPPPIP